MSGFDPAAYHARLKAHDWWHEMSDSASVFKRGKAEQAELLAIAETEPLATKMWNAWTDYVGWKREKEPTLKEFVNG